MPRHRQWHSRREEAPQLELDLDLDLDRELLAVVAEFAGAALGAALGGSPTGERLGIDLAVALRLLQAMPELRRGAAGRIGRGATELLLAFADGVDHALLRGPAGPLVALLEHGLVLRERQAHHRLGQRLEVELRGRGGPAPPPSGALRQGPIERYGERAAMGSLGAFAFALGTSGNLEAAAGTALTSLPRPAVLGRTSFSLELSHRLAGCGAVVLDPAALERLDRIDCVVIDQALLDPEWGQALLAAARAAGLLRVVVAEADTPWAGEADRRCPPGPAAVAAVRALQAEGLGVMVMAAPDQPALAVADLAVGFRQGGRPVARLPHVIAGPDRGAAWLLLPACGAARRCAEQSVQVALIEVVVGLALCLDGVNRRTSLAVNQATHVLALIAMANGLRLAHGITGCPPAPAVDPTPWHAMEVEAVLQKLAAQPSGPDPAAAQRQRWPGAELLALLLQELDNPLVPVLTAGAALSALLTSPVDAGLILAVLAGNALMGALQRLQVERSLAALQTHHAALVWRRQAGALRQVEAERLRPGDVIVLEAGEVVPADCRLLSASGLQLDEAILTGESFPVAKSAAPCAAMALAERASMLYAGTTVVAGSAEAVVIALGEATEARRGLAAVRDAAVAGGVEARLEALTEITTPIATMSGVAVLIAALARGQDPRAALAEGVALAVAAVPEGLPVLASLAQFAAAARLSRERVLVRNPRAIESLGRIDVICLDKTGTLTTGRIRLVQVCDRCRCMAPHQLDAGGGRVLELALLATPRPEAGKQLVHPTDRGLVEAAAAAGIDRGHWRQLAVLPFEPSRGFHASLVAQAQQRLLCVKGSPELVLAACRQPEPHWAATAAALAEQGLRVLAVASRPWGEAPLVNNAVAELELAGFVALEDPIRATARQALLDLRRAGVEARIITGDHPATARAIARQLQLPHNGTVLTGPMLEAMGDSERRRAVLEASVYARITSLQKMQIVQVLQQAGRVVAMTGDGANDAPAIRLAEVGIALGSRATEAARNAADLVVTDGRIETIVRAVLEGRALWRSVRDAVGLLVGGNLGEIGFTVVSGLVEGRPALNTRQLLLLNLLTDVAPALSIAMRPPGALSPEQLLAEGPEASLGQALDQSILRTATITALSSGVARAVAGLGGDQVAANTVGLLTLVGTQLGQAMATRRSDAINLLSGAGSFAGLLAAVQTPVLSQAFGCRPLGPLGLLQAGTATAMGTGAGLLAAGLQRWLVRTRVP